MGNNIGIIDNTVYLKRFFCFFVEKKRTFAAKFKEFFQNPIFSLRYKTKMNINKAVTYSLLAHIRNSGTLIKGPIDVFVPLVKRILYILNKQGVTKGQSIMEIKRCFDENYFIDIPIPVLSVILETIARDINKSEQTGFQLFQDKSFLIKDYVFDEFEDQLQSSQGEAEKVQEYFVEFCGLCNFPLTDKTSIFDFVDKNKVSLSKYLSNSTNKNRQDFTIEAKFIEFFKNLPSAYNFIKRVYLGSILSCYLEYKTENIQTNIELVLDTNFIISLLDLNTPESTHTCNKLIEIGLIQGYKFTVLIDTLEETQFLLRSRAMNFNNVFLQSRINPEDIYNACVRRNLKANDLERIADNLEKELNDKNIFTLSNTKKYINIAKYSKEYTALKSVRSSPKSALHDATVIHYVREKRGKEISDFEKVNCWLVHNSNSHESDFKGKDTNLLGGKQPETIKGDELLNVLWLSNPAITKNIAADDISQIGLSSLVAFSLNETLPKTAVIRELESNIQKYAEQEISDNDIILVSTRIVNRQLKNIQELNNLANIDKTAFVDRLKKEAENQRTEENQRIENLTLLMNKMQEQVTSLKSKEEDFNNQITFTKEREKSIEREATSKIDQLQKKLLEEQEERIKLENTIKEEKRNQFINKEIKRWRTKSLIEFTICILLLICYTIFALYKGDWDIAKAANYIKENIIISSIFTLFSLIFSGIVINSLILKYRNFSNIEAFKKNIKIPDELK